jgi:hypothetical protein
MSYLAQPRFSHIIIIIILILSAIMACKTTSSPASYYKTTALGTQTFNHQKYQLALHDCFFECIENSTDEQCYKDIYYNAIIDTEVSKKICPDYSAEYIVAVTEYSSYYESIKNETYSEYLGKLEKNGYGISFNYKSIEEKYGSASAYITKSNQGIKGRIRKAEDRKQSNDDEQEKNNIVDETTDEEPVNSEEES